MELTNQAPAINSIDVRRDWSLTVDVIDTTYGIDTGVVLGINGTGVTVTEISIIDGRRIEYTPGSSSSYGERITATITATPTGQAEESITWRFTITAGAITATASAPPLVVVVRDISLDADEADENHNGIEVVWLQDKTHPLIVTEDQAEAVGTVSVNDNTYHQHRRTLEVYRTDQNDDAVADLQEGDLIDYIATAINETAQKAEVLAIQQTIDQDDDVLYQLLVQHYEAV
jgi:hypothetical protein